MGKMDHPGINLSLPLKLVDSSFYYGSHGTVRIVDATHRFVCELESNDRKLAELIIQKLSA